MPIGQVIQKADAALEEAFDGIRNYGIPYIKDVSMKYGIDAAL